MALWGLFILQGSFRKFQYLFGGHAHDISGVLPTAEYDIRKPGFCLLQLAYLLLDGVPGDELIDLHVFLLPDTVSAVGSLIFNRAVPPRVVVYNNVRAGEVKPHILQTSKMSTLLLKIVIKNYDFVIKHVDFSIFIHT